MTVASLGEDKLIARLFAPIAGEGSLALLDDAALLKPSPGNELVITLDTLIAGIHFFLDDSPGSIARKALRVNLSDLAAKGAEPIGFLLSLSLPGNQSLSWLTAFAEGLGADSRAYRCGLLGGDTVRTPGPLTISITAFGRVPTGYMVRRTGAQPGDVLAVTGTIGDSALGLAMRLDGGTEWRDELIFDDQAYLADRYLLPQPRNALAVLLREYASGAMDISDGLVGDLRKFLRASGVGGEVDLARVPLSQAVRNAVEIRPGLFETAVTGGDDYEILFSVPQKRFAGLASHCAAAGVEITPIGTVTATDEPPKFIRMGEVISFNRESYSHF